MAALTGSGGFLVSEISRGTARARVKVALLDKDPTAVHEVVSGILEEGGHAIAIEMDVTKKSDFQRALDMVLNEFECLDYAVFGANLNAPTPILEISEDEWHTILDVQLTGTMLGSALGNLPTGEEVAQACLFLASPAASANTGQCINLDCGMLPQ